MKKRTLSLLMAASMTAGLLAGCGSSKPAETTAAPTTAAATTAAETKAEETTAAKEETEAAGGVLVMATNAEFPPYEYHDGGEIVGIDVEIAKAIADKMGMELEIEDVAFDSVIPEITSGKADMGLAGMTVTEDRKVSVDFSDTYAKASQMIIVKEDSAIAGPDDLKGVVVGVQLGTTGDIYVSDLEAEGTTVERYNKGFEAVQALSQGKIDAVVIDGEPAKTFVAETEGIKMLDEAFTEEEYAIAVKKGNTELLDKINGALKELKEDGTVDDIMNNYIGDNIGETPYESPEDVDRSNGTLVMATNAEFEPYEYREGDEVVGIDADIAQAICDKLGYELEIDDMEFDAILAAVQSGKADFGAAGMTVTEDRLESVDFTDTYANASQVIIVKAD